MIGKVIEGRYEGASINKLPDKNVLFIQTEDGTKIALSKSNAISIDDVTDQYPSHGRKVMMVMWNDFETSVFQLGMAKQEELPQNRKSDESKVGTAEKRSAGLAQHKKEKGHTAKFAVFILVPVVLTLVLASVWLLNTCTIGHKWEDADCVHPKQCLKCGITEGNVQEHTYEHRVASEPSFLVPGVNQKICTVCGDEKCSYVYLEPPTYFWNTVVDLGDGINAVCYRSRETKPNWTELHIYSSKYTDEELLESLIKYSDKYGFDGEKLYKQIKKIMATTYLVGNEYLSDDLSLQIGDYDSKGAIKIGSSDERKLMNFLGIKVLDYDGNQHLSQPRVREETDTAPVDNKPEYADQAVLEAIEKSVERRMVLADMDDTGTDHLRRLVNEELAIVAEYEDELFQDKTLENIFRKYINGLYIQKDALELSYSDSQIEWQRGLVQRYEALKELYEKYDVFDNNSEFKSAYVIDLEKEQQRLTALEKINLDLNLQLDGVTLNYVDQYHQYAMYQNNTQYEFNIDFYFWFYDQNGVRFDESSIGFTNIKPGENNKFTFYCPSRSRTFDFFWYIYPIQ